MLVTMAAATSIAGKDARRWSPVTEVQSTAEGDTQSQRTGAQVLCVSDLFKEHHADLMRFLRRRVPAGAAEPEDIAQECYIRMLQYEGSRSVRSPYFLLLRVAMNMITDVHRARRVRHADRHRPLAGLELAGAAPDPECAALHAEALERVLGAIEDLTPRCRQVFLTHRFSHNAYPAIARDLGISVKMVEKYISTALARCTDRMAET